jgi:hypothetical protein
MSGLTVFFRDYLSPDENDNAEYDGSLIDRLPTQQASEVAEATENRGAAYHDEDESAQRLSIQGQWYKERKAVFSRFMNRRLGLFVEEENATQLSQLEDQPNETQQKPPDTQQDDLFETQQPFSYETQAPFAPTTPAVKPKLAMVPCVDSLSDIVSHVSDISLFSSLVHVPVSQVTHCWGYQRCHRRHAAAGGSKYLYYYYAFPQVPEPLPLLPRTADNPYLLDDGPLATVYNQCLSMELLTSAADDAIRHYVEAIGLAAATTTEQRSQQRIRCRRILVYFYGRYAEILDHLLKQEVPRRAFFKRTNGANVTGTDTAPVDNPTAAIPGQAYVRLSHVPAKCVFPYHATDWYQRQVVADVCLGIGDLAHSRLSLPVDDTGERLKVSFDQEDLQVAIGWISPTIHKLQEHQQQNHPRG